MLCDAVLVLPGRVARLDAELRMENLTLKGIFVRYISHEIRYTAVPYTAMLYTREYISKVVEY